MSFSQQVDNEQRKESAGRNLGALLCMSANFPSQAWFRISVCTEGRLELAISFNMPAWWKWNHSEPTHYENGQNTSNNIKQVFKWCWVQSSFHVPAEWKLVYVLQRPQRFCVNIGSESMPWTYCISLDNNQDTSAPSYWESLTSDPLYG